MWTAETLDDIWRHIGALVATITRHFSECQIVEFTS
jgi:hypothetical protein